MRRVEVIVETTCREAAGRSFKLNVEWKQFHKEKNFKTFGSTSSKLHVRMFHFIMRCLRKVHDMKLWLGSSVNPQVLSSLYTPIISYVSWMIWIKFSTGESTFEGIVLLYLQSY
jgi:hypothetical protein